VGDSFLTLLDGDEKVLWSGGPSAERLLMRNDYWLIPGGVLVGIVGLAGLLVSGAQLLAGEGSWLKLLAALVCLVVGWEGVIGHTIRRRRRALRTEYVVTDRRVLELRSGELVREVAFADEPVLRVATQYEGRATFKLGELTLFNIPGAARVESLIRQQLPAQPAASADDQG
jgi:hypothetical protein